MRDWDAMDEVEMAETLLRAARDCGAERLQFSCDNRGAQIFFHKGAELHIFDHLPTKRCERLVRYLKQASGIDPYREPPQEGFGALQLDEREIALTVRTVPGSVGEDLTVSICEMQG